MVEAVTLLHGRSQTKVIGMPEEKFFSIPESTFPQGGAGLGPCVEPKDQGSTKVRTTAQTVLGTLLCSALHFSAVLPVEGFDTETIVSPVKLVSFRFS